MKNYQTEFPLEYCALRFLIQWLRNEQSLHQAIASSLSDIGIRHALAYFQVARNFKGLSQDLTTTSIIRKALLSIRGNESLSADSKVEKLASSLQSHFQKFNLSAASKLLWLSFRDPFVIYDNRAVTALSRNFKHKFSVRNYADYTKVWRTQYGYFESDITAAVKQLPKGRMFMPACLLSDEELLKLTDKTWFKERVFDIFLWEIGGKK